MSKEPADLESLATSLINRTLKTNTNITKTKTNSGWELSVRVRLGEPELVQEAGHRGVSLRVMKGGRVYKDELHR